jgi:UDPglucose 6-dehydrogenase
VNVCVLGLWHLGSVTAACLASAGHDVVGVDFDAAVIDGLAAGTAPIDEPGLNDLLRKGLAAGTLRFATDPAVVAHADVVWVTYDTPVDDDDRADVECVVDRVDRVFPHLRDGALVLVSSQMPVGSTRRLRARFETQAEGRRVAFACSPENLRLGQAISVFTQPDRVVVGVSDPADRDILCALFRPITDRLEWMSVESAEMTKHAINAFLAASVTFINELATLCEQVGADATEVERGLKSEARIGPRAYLSPGGAFAGGTLARDVMFLAQLGRLHGVPTYLFGAVKASNDAHRAWAQRRLEALLQDLRGKVVAVWGLTYKPGTDTLRRSSAVELCHWLNEQGAIVQAHDPAIRRLPDALGHVCLAATAIDAVRGASALVVATPWPQYRKVDGAAVAVAMTRPLVLDANRFLRQTVGAQAGVEYVSVGRGRV